MPRTLEQAGYDLQAEGFRPFVAMNRRVIGYLQPGKPTLYGATIDGWDAITDEVIVSTQSGAGPDQTAKLRFHDFLRMQLTPFGVGEIPPPAELAQWGDQVRSDVLKSLRGEPLPPVPPAEKGTIPQPFVVATFRALAAQLLADRTVETPEEALDFIRRYLDPTGPVAPPVVTTEPPQKPGPFPATTTDLRPPLIPATPAAAPPISPAPPPLSPQPLRGSPDALWETSSTRSSFVVDQRVRVERSNGQIEDDWLVANVEPDKIVVTKAGEQPGEVLTKDYHPAELQRLQERSLERQTTSAETNVASDFSTLVEFSQRQRLEPQAVYAETIQRGSEVLSQLEGIIELPKDVPTIVLPDIHGRRDFIVNVLSQTVTGPDGVQQTVFEALEQGKINLLCLGDYLHTEDAVGARRWSEINDLMVEGMNNTDAGKTEQAYQLLDEEMLRGLGLVKMLIDLKTRFPQHVYLLRGNHEDMQARRPYGKYAQLTESNLVKWWVKRRFGESFLNEYAHFEDQFPLMAVGNQFVASHAAPGQPLDRSLIAARDPLAVEKLTWTDNTNLRKQETDEACIDQTLAAVGATDARVWLVGHRPVEDGNYRLQFNNKLVQMNNANTQIMAYLPVGRPFNPDTDVHQVG